MLLSRNYDKSNCHPGLRGSPASTPIGWRRQDDVMLPFGKKPNAAQNKRRFVKTKFVTTPCAGRGLVAWRGHLCFTFLSNIYLKKIIPIPFSSYGSRPSPGIVARSALSGSCPAGQDDKIVIHKLKKFNYRIYP
jgi:hypothetical protein